MILCSVSVMQLGLQQWDNEMKGNKFLILRSAIRFAVTDLSNRTYEDATKNMEPPSAQNRSAPSHFYF